MSWMTEFDTFCDDFNAKMKLNLSENEIAEKSDQNNDDDYELVEKKLQQRDEEDEDESDEDEDSDFEFSFAFTNPDESPVSAEQIFSNGEIRPVFPLFNRDLLFDEDGDSVSSTSSNVLPLRSPLKKLFVENVNNLPSKRGKEVEEEEPTGEYCVWSGKTVLASAASPEKCEKSNSTGFSKLWRFRDLLHRSSSDGKDAFVFLHHNSTTKRVKSEQNSAAESSSGKVRKVAARGGGEKKKKALSSAHEMHYVRNRAIKEGDRRRSYLPYRQDLVGFFTSVNGLSRNVHPY